MVIQQQSLLKRLFDLLHWVIVFIKKEGINLINMATTLHSIIDYEPLKIFKVCEGTYDV